MGVGGWVGGGGVGCNELRSLSAIIILCPQNHSKSSFFLKTPFMNFIKILSLACYEILQQQAVCGCCRGIQTSGKWFTGNCRIFAPKSEMVKCEIWKAHCVPFMEHSTKGPVCIADQVNS